MPDKKLTYREKHGTTRVGDALRSLVQGGKQIAPEILEIAGSITGIKALDKLADKISGEKNLTEAEKIMLQATIEMDKQEMADITGRWQADMTSDSWLSKNIRPLTLGYLTICMTLLVVLDSAIKGFQIKPQWISLLETLLLAVYLAYFGSRGVEKFKKISKQ
jgi:hypothetical protein